jgi:hypothetical protein
MANGVVKAFIVLISRLARGTNGTIEVSKAYQIIFK